MTRPCHLPPPSPQLAIDLRVQLISLCFNLFYFQLYKLTFKFNKNILFASILKIESHCTPILFINNTQSTVQLQPELVKQYSPDCPENTTQLHICKELHHDEMLSNHSQKWQQSATQAPAGGGLSRQKQLQAKQHQQQLSHSQMQSAHKEGSAQRNSVQQVTKKDSQKLQSSVDRRRAVNHQVKVFNQNSVNSSNNSVKPTFSNSGSCSNLQMGTSPPHKLGPNGNGSFPQKQAKGTKNIRQLSVNTGSALQQQLNTQTLQAAKLTGHSQLNMSDIANGTNKQFSFGQNKLFQSQLQATTFNRHPTAIGVNQGGNGLFQKPLIQQRVQITDGGLNPQTLTMEMAAAGGNHQVVGGHLIMNGKALQQRGDSSNNFRNGFGLQANGVGQYSLRQGPPPQQSQNPMFQAGKMNQGGTWQVQKKANNNLSQQHHFHQQVQKSSMIPQINSATSAAGGYSSAMSKETKHSSSFPISHHNSLSSQQTGQQLQMALQQQQSNSSGGALPLYFNSQASKTQGQPTASRGLSYGLSNNQAETPIRVMTLQPGDSDDPPLQSSPIKGAQQFSPSANTPNLTAHKPAQAAQQFQAPAMPKDEALQKHLRMSHNDLKSSDNSASALKEPALQKLKSKNPYTSTGIPAPVPSLNNTQGTFCQQLLSAQSSGSRPTFMTSQHHAAPPGPQNFSSNKTNYRPQQDALLSSEKKGANRTAERQIIPGNGKQSNMSGQNAMNGQQVVYSMIMVNQNGQIISQGNRLPVDGQGIVHVSLPKGYANNFDELQNHSFQSSGLRAANLMVWPNHVMHTQHSGKPQSSADANSLILPLQQQPSFYSTASAQHSKHLKSNLANLNGSMASSFGDQPQIVGSNGLVHVPGGIAHGQILAGMDQQLHGPNSVFVPSGPQLRIIAQKSDSRQAKGGAPNTASHLHHITETASSAAMSHEYTNSYSKQTPNGQLVAVQGTIKGFNQQRTKGKKRSLSSEKKLESMGLAQSAQRSRADQTQYENEDYTPLKTEKIQSAGIAARMSHEQQSMSARSSRLDNKRNTVHENRVTNTNVKTKGSGQNLGVSNQEMRKMTEQRLSEHQKSFISNHNGSGRSSRRAHSDTKENEESLPERAQPKNGEAPFQLSASFLEQRLHSTTADQSRQQFKKADFRENFQEFGNCLVNQHSSNEMPLSTATARQNMATTSLANPMAMEMQSQQPALPSQIHTTTNQQREESKQQQIEEEAPKSALDEQEQQHHMTTATDFKPKGSTRVAKLGSNLKGMENGQLSCSLDDLIINIQDDEEEIGPVDDDDEDDDEEALLADDVTGEHLNTQGTSANKPQNALGTFINGHNPAGNLDIRTENQIANFNSDLDNGTGYYDCGDEPEEDDSQIDVDEQEEFDDCAEEDGEDDMLGAEEGEEETAIEQKADGGNAQPLKQADSSKQKAPSSNDVDMHSKVSTSCTNIGADQITPLLKIKSANTDGKAKRKYTKSKKGHKGRSKIYDEGGGALDEDLEGLDEEQRQRRIDLNMLDKQLDQLVIQKPATLINQNGKDRSLKEAFLRRPPNNVITFTYGPIPGRPPTILFNYPPFLKKVRPQSPSKTLKLTQEEMKPYSTLTFKINNSTHTYNCVVNAFKIAGFRLCEGGSWNCLWTGLIRPSKLKYMHQYQKINHFAGAWNIGHKGNLWRNVQRQRRRHGREFEICPPTYLFPEDYKKWNADREASNFRDMYIMKPSCSSCGRGIRVIGKKQTVGKRQGYLVQKYLSKPHLLRGYKYDMRIYIVVTSFEPLKAYQFSQGLVRLATQPYSTSKGSLKKRFIHLTNFSINKKAENYKRNDGIQVQGDGQQPQPIGAESSSTAQDTEEGEMSSKWSLEQLRQEYEKMGVNYDSVFKQVKSLCIKTLMAVEPQITTSMRTSKHRNQCFEIYGFDIIIDHKLRPWLLEVNVAPSLSSSSPYDKQVKTMLLCDTLHLVGFQPFDRKMIEESKKKELRHRLLGFEPSKNGKSVNRQHEDSDMFIPSMQQKNIQSQTPVKQKAFVSEINSPDKIERSNTKSNSIRDKIVIPSFLDGFSQLTEDDMAILADYEEEQSRKGHFETIFPTRETIEALGNHFDIQRHANSVLWQYIRQKQPIHHLKSYYKAHPYIP